MCKTILSLIVLACSLGNAFAEDQVYPLNGTLYRIDIDGNLWRQKGGFWIEVRRDGTFKNTQRLSASQSDNLLIVLQNNWLHAVNPDNGNYTVLTRGLTYDPRKISGLCGLNKFCYFVFEESLVRVRLDGTGGLESLHPETRWFNTEGMASNQNTMIIVQGGCLHRLYADGTYKGLTKGTVWTGTTSIFPASDDSYVITQRGVLHHLTDVDGIGAYKWIQP